jgi:hypothetical protein
LVSCWAGRSLCRWLRCGSMPEAGNRSDAASRWRQCGPGSVSSVVCLDCAGIARQAGNQVTIGRWQIDRRSGDALALTGHAARRVTMLGTRHRLARPVSLRRCCLNLHGKRGLARRCVEHAASLRQQHEQKPQPRHCNSRHSLRTRRGHRYLVMRPIVSTSSSTLCRCSTGSPETKAPATQCDT